MNKKHSYMIRSGASEEAWLRSYAKGSDGSMCATYTPDIKKGIVYHNLQEVTELAKRLRATVYMIRFDGQKVRRS